MTIDRTKVKPSMYLEIDGVDVSDYIIDSGNMAPTSKEKISSGNFNLTKDVDNVIVPKKFSQIINFYVEFDNKYKRFGGIITDLKEDKQNNKYICSVRSFAWKCYQTKFTGVFRSDAGKGNRKTIITDILTEKFPGVTWDATSFPDIDSSFDILYKNYNNKNVGDIFDELLEPTDRDWWIDKDNKFHGRLRTYTQVDAPVTLGTQTIGIPIIDVNNNYANLVLVFGKKFEKEIVHTFSGTGTTDEFTLDFYPIGSSDVSYDDGTLISVTMEGNEDYDDPTVYDAYFKQSEKKIKFNVNTAVGADNIIVTTRSYDQIKEEYPSAGEISRIGFEVVKEIRNENISTPDEALLVAKNWIDSYGEELYIYLVNVKITTDEQLENWKIGNSINLDLTGVSGYENIIQENWSWGPTNVLNLQLRFVDFPRTDNDVLKDLLKKITLQEQQVDSASTNLTRFFYMGTNIIVNFQNFSLKYQDASDYRFQLQENEDLQDDRSLMSEDGTIPSGGIGSGVAAEMTEDDYSTTLYVHSSKNEQNKYVLSFTDRWFVDETNTTSTFDTTNMEIRF